MKRLSVAMVLGVLLAASGVLVHEALGEKYPHGCGCRYYANVNLDNCDPNNSGNCCPNPCEDATATTD